MAVIRLGNLGWKNNTEPVSPTNPWHSKDVNSDAIKNKVDTLATEATLEQVRALLSGVATENKLEQARTLLEAISTKDFATSSKQDALNIAVEALKSELILVKSELANIKANQLSGDQKVQLSGQTMAPGDTIPVQQSAIVLDRLEQIERALLISAGLRHEYYIDGMEYATGGWVEGITSGPVDWWERYKAEDHMYFFTQRNPDGRTDVSYVTKEKVDLTDVRFVYVELEAKVLNHNHSANSPNLYLIASTNSEGGYGDYEARSTIYETRGGSSEGRIIRGLNVTGLTGEYYLRLHIASHVTADPASFDLETKIFRVWGE